MRTKHDISLQTTIDGLLYHHCIDLSMLRRLSQSMLDLMHDRPRSLRLSRFRENSVCSLLGGIAERLRTTQQTLQRIRATQIDDIRNLLVTNSIWTTVIPNYRIIDSTN